MALFKSAFRVVLALCVAGNAAASVTFVYTGNSFDAPATPPEFLGKRIVASVTFDDTVIGLTGVVGSSAVLSWSIEVDQVPGTRLTSSTGVTNPSWPLWFRFDNGAIADWQLLAEPSSVQRFPEIYTTHNSPYSSIYPTADYYSTVETGTVVRGNLSNPGTWVRQSTMLDHFQCYAAKGEAPKVYVDLTDESGTATVLVGKPELFCSPVDKNGEGIRNPTAHLICYKIRGESAKQEVRVTNQFGEQTLKVKPPELLCVPSERVEVPQ